MLQDRHAIDRPSFEKSLAARLIANGKLDEAAADRAFRVRAESAERLEQILTKLGLVHERDVADAMSRELALPLVAPGDFPDAPVLEGASAKFLRQAQALLKDVRLIPQWHPVWSLP